MVSNDLATLAELQTVYSLEDVYVLMEIFLVTRHNRRLADQEIRKMQKQKGRR